MFQKGDLIVYGNMGVCRVEAVEAPAGLPGAGEKKLYYKLDPVYETGTVYIPVDAKVFMRPILTHAHGGAHRRIRSWGTMRREGCGPGRAHNSLNTPHGCDDLVQLIETIYGKTGRTAQGKESPHVPKTEYMKRTEGCFAVGWPPRWASPLGQVPGYIAAEGARAGCGAET